LRQPTSGLAAGQPFAGGDDGCGEGWSSVTLTPLL
jgi:hypothetical protein